jgi:hypothetical protein
MFTVATEEGFYTDGGDEKGLPEQVTCELFLEWELTEGRV